MLAKHVNGSVAALLHLFPPLAIFVLSTFARYSSASASLWSLHKHNFRLNTRISSQQMPVTMFKRATNGDEGGLSYEAITAITIGVAGFVMLMVVACAVNMRRKKGTEGKIDAADLDPEQQVYMREARNRNRDTLTGTNYFTANAKANPPSRQPSTYMARSGMSSYGYDDVYTPGWDSKPVSRRQSGYADNYSLEADYLRSPDPADAEYFSHKSPPVGQGRPLVGHAGEPTEKPSAHTAIQEAEPTPYSPEEQYQPAPKAQ